MSEKGLMFEGEIGSICEDKVEHDFQSSLGCDPYFVDDVSGAVLDSSLVRDARKDEVRGVLKHNVFFFRKSP